MKFLHLRIILYTLGIVLLFESFFLLLDIPVALIYHPEGVKIIIYSLLIMAGTGLIGVMASKRQKATREPGVRDSFVIVSLGWLVMSLFGTLPYLLSGAIPRFADAFFECVSGFTTTGSSILTDIEVIPKEILFWRAETHWIGGMGIIVLVVAVLPFFNIGGNRLFSAEASMVSFEKIKPKVIDTAKRLWLIYVVLTFAETILLMFAGMDLFDGLCHSFATVATGGFSTRNASLAAFSPAAQYIATLFMFLSGMNFALHYFSFKGDFGKVFKNEEFRLYGFIVIAATLNIPFVLIRHGGKLEKSFRDAVFQVVSIITCTGFATADYLQWPTKAWILIFILMFIGGCAGSTAGGIKVIRHLLIYKTTRNIFQRMVNPNRIIVIKYNNQPVDHNALSGIMSYAFMYLFTFVLGSVIMIFSGLDIESAMGSVITTLGGIGPGLGIVGPAGNFAAVSIFGKYFLCLMMILGRLEFYSFLALLMPGFWKL